MQAQENEETGAAVTTVRPNTISLSQAQRRARAHTHFLLLT